MRYSEAEMPCYIVTRWTFLREWMLHESMLSSFWNKLSVSSKQRYQNPNSEENKICNYNRVILKLNQAIELFLSQRADNWFINMKRRLTDVTKKPFQFLDVRDESRRRYMINTNYFLRWVPGEWRNREMCLGIMILNFRISWMFVIAVEDPAKYGIMSLSENKESDVYREDARNVK